MILKKRLGNLIFVVLFSFVSRGAFALSRPVENKSEDTLAVEIQAMTSIESIMSEEEKTRQEIRFYQTNLRQLGKMGVEDFGGNSQAFNEAMDSTEAKVHELFRKDRLLLQREKELENEA